MTHLELSPSALFCVHFQIFYDLVRQINRKSPEKKMPNKKKHKCTIL